MDRRRVDEPPKEVGEQQHRLGAVMPVAQPPRRKKQVHRHRPNQGGAEPRQPQKEQQSRHRDPIPAPPSEEEPPRPEEQQPHQPCVETRKGQDVGGAGTAEEGRVLLAPGVAQSQNQGGQQHLRPLPRPAALPAQRRD